MTPVITRRPPLIGEWMGLPAPLMLNGMVNFVPHRGFWNHTGQPAAAVPVETAPDGFPVAVQLVGRTGDEETLLVALGAARTATGWLERRPPLGGMSLPDELLALASRRRARGGRRPARRVRPRARDQRQEHADRPRVRGRRLTERLIRSRLEAARPDDAILGEEGDDRPGTSGLRWVVDPLDGTVNFLFGIPEWCVSIACEDAGGVLAGVVFDPMRGETWAATRDGAATLDGVPLRGSRAQPSSRPRWSQRDSAMTPRCASSRRA